MSKCLEYICHPFWLCSFDLYLPSRQCSGLQPIGESFYVETDSSGAPIVGNPQDAGLGRVIQGALEASNVNVVTELVSMIETQRAYEVSSKSITSVDEMLRYISQNL